MLRIGLFLALLVTSGFTTSCFSANAATDPNKPKYGPLATPLSISHEYFRANAAPDFWALSPYYAAQQTDGACSLASVTMVMNAARVGKKLLADDELVTQVGLVDRLKEDSWKKAVGLEGIGGRGVTLDQLGSLIEKSLASYGFDQAKVEVVHIVSSDADTKKKLHTILLANEKSNQNFIIANFIQGIYTGDAEVGHIAPVGAYDAAKKRVLIMDPDRRWYEPYWISEDTFLKGMATSDSESGTARGYVWIQLR